MPLRVVQLGSTFIRRDHNRNTQVGATGSTSIPRRGVGNNKGRERGKCCSEKAEHTRSERDRIERVTCPISFVDSAISPPIAYHNRPAAKLHTVVVVHSAFLGTNKIVSPTGYIYVQEGSSRLCVDRVYTTWLGCGSGSERPEHINEVAFGRACRLLGWPNVQALRSLLVAGTPHVNVCRQQSRKKGFPNQLTTTAVHPSCSQLPLGFLNLSKYLLTSSSLPARRARVCQHRLSKAAHRA